MTTAETVDAMTATTAKGGIGGTGIGTSAGGTGPGPGIGPGNIGPGEPRIIIEKVKRGRVRTWVVRFARTILFISIAGFGYLIYCPSLKKVSHAFALNSLLSRIRQPSPSESTSTRSVQKESRHSWQWMGVNGNAQDSRHRGLQRSTYYSIDPLTPKTLLILVALAFRLI